MPQKKDFTIQRQGNGNFERTVVGKDGQKHVSLPTAREGTATLPTKAGTAAPSSGQWLKTAGRDS